tara:strand:- start:11823 stop:13103 length:1281 start_codon:yes stop_codon:yes gene_type:complete
MSDYAGSYNFKRVSITKNNNTSDITDLVTEVNVFAYIEQPSTTVIISIKDSTNFLNDFPIKGGQEIEIEVEFDNEQRIWNLVVASVENTNNSLNATVYNLRCVSHLLFKSHYTTISQSFEGKVSDIAESIFNQYKNDKESIRIWDESINSSSYVIPGWSPVQTLIWLASKSRAKNTNTRFKFFQDSFLNYNFLPVEILNEKYLEDDIQNFYYHIDKTNNIERKMREVQEITSYKINDSNDILGSFANGFISGELFEYNTTSKNSNTINHNYFNDFETFKDETANKKPLWKLTDLSGSFAQEIFGNGLEIEQVSRFRDDDLSDVSEILDKSNVVNSYFNLSNNLITIDIKGNNVTDIGQIVNLFFPKTKPLDPGNLKDEMLSGRYLVVGKRQQFSKNDNVIQLECIRDSNIITSVYSGNDELGGEEV